jgi:hypothetical protein
MADTLHHPPLYCCGEDTCPYDYCADEADEMIEGCGDLEEALDYCLDERSEADPK